MDHTVWLKFTTVSYGWSKICPRESLKGHLAILKIHQYQHFTTALMKGLGRDAWIGAWAKGTFYFTNLSDSDVMRINFCKHII